MEIVKETDQFFKEMEENVSKIDSQGFCTCGSKNFLEILEKQKIHLLQIDYFWSSLSKLEPREGYFEVHHPPDFNDINEDLKRNLKSLLEAYLPPEQAPVTLVKKETIEIPIKVPVHDKVRLAHELLFGFCRAQNIPDSLAIYHEEADKYGNIHACNALGDLYSLGTIIPRDPNKAKHYYEKSADARDPEGLYHKGTLYEKGVIMCENRVDKALECYEEASSLGNLDAATDLGFIYEHGVRDEASPNIFIVEPNLDYAMEKYKTGVKANFPRALNNLGLLLSSVSYNETIKGENRSKAFRYFEKAASYGYVKALFNLAMCYEKGIGVSSDPIKALSIYKEAAYKGDLTSKLYYAYHSLRRASMDEEDFEGNLSESARFMLELTFVKPNLAEPYYYLGTLYENGFTVAQDYKSALNYYTKAASLGHPPSVNKIGDFYNSGSGGLLKSEELALKYYKEAAELRSVDAIINLGTIFEEGGYGKMERDLKKAFEFYEKAANLGDSRGFLNMGFMYEKGKYVEKSRSKALEFYQMAAEQGDSTARNLLDMKGELVKGKGANIRPPEEFINTKSILGSRIVVNLAKNCAKIGVKGGYNVANKYEKLENKR